MATRLQRLIALLDSGSTPAVRNAAAVQLGDIQRQRPQDLFLILAPVVSHLRSPSWDTRSAAATAIEEIARALPEWDPLPPPPPPSSSSHSLPVPHPSLASPSPISASPPPSSPFPYLPDHLDPSDPSDPAIPPLSSDLLFSDVSFSSIVHLGHPLLSSAGAEYDPPPDLALMDPKERLKYMRRQVREQLGIETAMGGEADLIDEADLLGGGAVGGTGQSNQGQAGQTHQGQMGGSAGHPGAGAAQAKEHVHVAVQDLLDKSRKARVV
ncbi:btaf1 RNA polymerase II, B-TFIID transcription factor-associated, 170kDa [Gonapodya sp. JEL0774]|nr:btaf1 RNA polymerase II, B-TFIID transcription factor-associated, 170kDa [Gonapodya sp. JEL0774]